LQLDDRKEKILELIIDRYIKYGQPVGSKTISELMQNSISPATIRNEMSILYDIGFLEQPHKSAGRIPSQLGYRFYLDKLMQKKTLCGTSLNELDLWMNIKDPDYNNLIENTGKILSQITACMSILSSMVFELLTITKIEILKVSNHTIAIVVLTSSGIVKSKICKLNFDLNNDTINLIKNYVNKYFSGKSIECISKNYITYLVSDLDIYTALIIPILYIIYDICNSLHQFSFFINGQVNLLNYKVLEDNIADIIKILSNKDEVNFIIDEYKSKKNKQHLINTDVILGRELKKPELSNISLIISGYNIGTIGKGNIIIVGPNRLDYSSVIPWVEYFSKSLSLILSELLDIK